MANDAFGDDYKIVMRALRIRHPPTQMTETERTDLIEELFPRKQPVNWLKEPTGGMEGFTREELLQAASRLQNQRELGQDGLPPEVIKMAVTAYRGYILEVFNKLLHAEKFPEIWQRAKLEYLR